MTREEAVELYYLDEISMGFFTKESLHKICDYIEELEAKLDNKEDTLLVQALEEYFSHRPEKGEVKIFPTGVKMKDMPNEIRNNTSIGKDYAKACYKMAIENFIDENNIKGDRHEKKI